MRLQPATNSPWRNHHFETPSRLPSSCCVNTLCNLRIKMYGCHCPLVIQSKGSILVISIRYKTLRPKWASQNMKTKLQDGSSNALVFLDYIERRRSAAQSTDICPPHSPALFSFPCFAVVWQQSCLRGELPIQIKRLNSPLVMPMLTLPINQQTKSMDKKQHRQPNPNFTSPP